MEYRRFKDTIILRLDPLDEILKSIEEVIVKENIILAEVNGLGATNKFTIGRFDLDKLEYEKYSFTGSYEISSLHGNVTTMNDKPYLHLHIVCGTKDGVTVSGHLNEAYISVTSEIFIRIIDGKVDREKNKDTFINTIKF